MADNENKTLNEIKAILINQNASQKQLTDAYEKSQRAFPAESFKTITKETSEEIKKQRLKNATRFFMYIFIGLIIESCFF